MLTSLPSSSKYLLLNHLNRSNMYDLASYTNTLDHTWSSNRYSSRIDYIWAAQTIIPYLTTFYLDDPSSSTHSDHQILISQWSFPTCQQPKHKHRNKRCTFNYKAMTTKNGKTLQTKSTIISNITIFHLILQQLNPLKKYGTRYKSV